MADPTPYSSSMDCADLHAALRAGTDPADPELSAHARLCPACAELLEANAELGRLLAAADAAAPEEDTADVRAAVQRAVAADTGPRAALRRLPTIARLGLVLGVLAVVVAMVGLFMTRPDWSVYPMLRMELVLGSLGLMAVGTAWYAMRPLYLAGLPRGLHGAALLSAVMLPLALNVLPVAHHDHPMAYRPEPFWPPTLMCFTFGTAVGLVVVAWLWAVERRSRMDKGVLLLGVALGGLAGNLALQVQCPVTDVLHLVVGHAMIGAVWVAVVGVLRR